MSDTCETVKIKTDNEQGFIVINKSDMTKDHIEFSEETETKRTSIKREKNVNAR